MRSHDIKRPWVRFRNSKAWAEPSSVNPIRFRVCCFASPSGERSLECFLEQTQQTKFVEVHRTVVDQPAHRGCQPGKIRELFFREAQSAQAFGYSHFRSKLLDEVRGLGGRSCIRNRSETGIQAARDERHLGNARWHDASHHRG